MKYVGLVFAFLLATTCMLAQGSWTQQSNFAGTARSNAVRFVIGNHAYVGTGYEGNTQLQDFWKYDAETNTWTEVAEFPGGVRENAVAFSIDGKGYVGTGSSGPYRSTVLHNDFWQYDPSANVWKKVANFGGTARHRAVAFVINGRGYVTTGEDNASAKKDLWEYNPTEDTWIQRADLPSTPRKDAIAFAINGRGYVGTGFNIENGSSIITNNLFAYDPVRNIWQGKIYAHSLLGRQNATSFVVGEKAYFGAGNSKKDFVQYDPFKNELSVVSDFGPSNEDNRWSAIGFSLSGKGYVGLGFYSVDFRNTSLKDDLWSFEPPVLPNAPSDLTATAVNETTLQLDWTDNSNNETHFVLEWSPTGEEGSFTEERPSPVTSHQLSRTRVLDTHLDENKRYYYRVKAVNEAGSSEFSDIITPRTSLKKPTKFVAYPGSSRQIILEWYGESDSTDQVVVEKAVDNSLFSSIDTIPYSKHNQRYVDNAIDSGNLYSYRLKAIVSTAQPTYSFLASATADRRLGAWSRKSNVPSSVHGSGFSVGGSGYVGFNNFYADNEFHQAFWRYDDVADSWVRLNDIPFAETLHIGSFTIGNTLYVGNGRSRGSSFQTPTYGWWSYDATTDQWSAIMDAPVNVSQVSFSVGDKGYLVHENTLYTYDAAANEWASSSIPNESAFLQVFTIGEQAYLGTRSGEFWKYDPALDSWTQIADFPGRVHDRNLIFSLNHKGYIASGANNGEDYTNGFFTMYASGYSIKLLWEYDPQADTWRMKSALDESLFTHYGIHTNFATDQHAFIVSRFGMYQFSSTTLNAPAELAIDYEATTPYLVWQDDSDSETSYTVERALYGTDDFTVVATLPADTERYADEGIAESESYHYRVAAQSELNASRYSREVGMLSAYFTAKARSTDEYIKLSVDWPEREYPMGYIPYKHYVERRKESADDFTALGVMEVTGSGGTIFNYSSNYVSDDRTILDNVDVDKIYHYRIRYEYNNILSQPAYVTGGTQLLTPSNVRITSDKGQPVSLTWDDNSSVETNYVIRRGSVPEEITWAFADTLPANTTSYIDRGPLDIGTYYYQIIAVNQYNQSEIVADTISISWATGEDGPVMSLPDERAQEDVVVYPNPGTGLFSIKSSHSTIGGRWYLYDARGHLKRTIKSGTKELDLRDLPRGMYLLRLETANGSSTQKIVKQ